MISNILVGIDDSDGTAVALRWTAALVAAEEARGHEVRVTAVAAWTSPALDVTGAVDPRLLEEAAGAVVEGALADVPGSQRFERIVVPGPPADVIADEAARLDADLIVVGSRGRGGLTKLLFGSVSRKVASQAMRPVAVVPSTATWSDRPTVVGYDGSPGAEAALRWAATNGDGPITLVSAWHLPTEAIYDPAGVDLVAFEANVREQLETAVAKLDAELPEAGVQARSSLHVEQDDPRLVLVEQADRGARLVLGARTHHGLRGLLLGSTVDYVASHSTQAVIVVPPTAGSTGDGAGDGGR